MAWAVAFDSMAAAAAAVVVEAVVAAAVAVVPRPACPACCQRLEALKNYCLFPIETLAAFPAAPDEISKRHLHPVHHHLQHSPAAVADLHSK